MLRGKLSQTTLIGDFAVTMIFAVVQLLLAPISTSLIARHLGANDFGTYSSIQRLIFVIAPLASVGVNIGVSRYVASARGQSDSVGYFWSALLTSTCGAFLIMLVFTWLPANFLGISHVGPSGWLLFLLLITYTALQLLNSWTRGNGDFLASNIMLILTEIGKLCLMLILIISGWQFQAALLLLMITVVQIAIGLGIVRLVRPIHFQPRYFSRKYFRQLLSYSAPRVPGGLSLQALNSLGVFYFSLAGNPASAGFMAISLVILNAGSLIFSRLGSILMPHLVFELSKSNEQNKGRFTDLPRTIKHQLSVVISLLLTSTAVIGGIGILVLPPLIVPWLGQDFAPTEMPVTILTSCIGLVALYSVLSGALNAADTRALNTINLVVTLILTGSLFLVTNSLNITQVAWMQAFGYTVLALLTVSTTYRLYSLSLTDIGLGAFLILAASNTAIVWIVLQTNQSLMERMLGVIAIVIVDLAIIWKTNPPWLQPLLGHAMRFIGSWK